MHPSIPWVEAMGFEETISEEAMVAVQKDFEYLKKMKLMDKDIIKKRKREKKGKKNKGEEEEGEEAEKKKKEGRFEMTDVVPVAGLIMARFTMYECEHLTALELWGKCKKPGFVAGCGGCGSCRGSCGGCCRLVVFLYGFSFFLFF